MIILIITIGVSIGISYATNTSNPFTAPYKVIDSNGNVTRMVIDSSGNVGIRTTTPQALLDVNGTIITRSQVPAISFMGDISGARWMQGLGNYMLSFYSDNSNQNGLGGTVSYNGETWVPKVEIGPDGTLYAAGNLYTAGKIGIGTTTPMTKLDLGANPSIFLEGNSNQWGFTINSTDYGNSNVPLLFTSRGSGVNSEVMRITHDGKVGIGTTSPTQKLDVNGLVHIGNDLILTRSDGVATGSIVADNSTTTGIDIVKMGGGNLNKIRLWANTLYASGNVGIGTTSPAQKLDVNGNIKVNGNLTSASTNEFKITAPAGVPICIGTGC